MPTHLIFWPILIVLSIPVFVLLLNAKRKADDRNAGNIQADSPINNTAWSLPVVLTSNSLANQFQLPVIFYVLCFILIHLNTVSFFILILSWVFAVSRCVHAFVHVTTNAIPWRFSSFLVGALCLLILFTVTIINLIQYQV